MTDLAVANPCETSTPNRVNPPPVRLPKLVQGIGFAFFAAGRCGIGSTGTGTSSKSTCHSSVNPSSFLKLPVAGLGALVDGPDGRGLIFQMSLPPKEFEATSSPAIREHMHRFGRTGDDIPRLRREVHG